MKSPLPLALLQHLNSVVARGSYVTLLLGLLLGEEGVEVVVRAAGLRLVFGLLALAAGEDGGAQQLPAVLVLPRTPRALLENDSTVSTLTHPQVAMTLAQATLTL